MLKISNENMYFTDTGEDLPTLLFVHGILLDHSVWRHQVTAFSGRYRVVCVDLRGFGRSTAQSPDISFEDHAADLAELITQLGLHNVTLVGWSMGGAISQVFASLHGAAISRLVLVDTSPQLLASVEFACALRLEAAQQLGELLAADFAQGCRAFCQMITPEDPEAATNLAAIASQTNPDVAFAAFGSSGQRSLLGLLADINIPTLVVAGADDRICPPDASRHLARAIPGCKAEARFIQGAGHAPFMTFPDQFNNVLQAFLG